MSHIQVLSLVVFVAVLAVAVWRRLNVGLVAFAGAFLVAGIGGVSAKELLAAFPGNLAVLVIGVTLLFSHAQRSGAVDSLTDRVLKMMGSRRWMIPWVGFVLAAIFGTIGGLPAAVVAIVMPIVSSLARSYRLNYLMMALMANWAAIAAGFSPLSPAGALFRTLADSRHFAYSPWGLYAIVMGIFALASLVAFVAFRGFRLTASSQAADSGEAVLRTRESGLPGVGVTDVSEPGQPGSHGFTRHRGSTASSAETAVRGDDLEAAREVSESSRQGAELESSHYRFASLIALLVLVVAVVGFRLDVGLTALSLAFLLQVVFCPSEKEILKGVAWPVVLLLAGLLVYLDLLSKLGTLSSIQDALSNVGSATVALLVLAYVTAAFSNMDSSTLVVLGAMGPIGLSLTDGSMAQVVAVLVVVATATAIVSMSPVHIDGSLIIANTPNNDEAQLFRKLIYLALIISIFIPGILSIYPILVST